MFSNRFPCACPSDCLLPVCRMRKKKLSLLIRFVPSRHRKTDSPFLSAPLSPFLCSSSINVMNSEFIRSVMIEMETVRDDAAAATTKRCECFEYVPEED